MFSFLLLKKSRYIITIIILRIPLHRCMAATIVKWDHYHTNRKKIKVEKSKCRVLHFLHLSHQMHSSTLEFNKDALGLGLAGRKNA